MGRIKEYLFGIAQDIHDGQFIDHEDLNYDGGKHDDRVIDAGINAYISREAEDDEMRIFLQNHTGALLDMVKDIIGISPDEPMTDEEEDQEWTDPAGGTHYGDEDDPAKMYEAMGPDAKLAEIAEHVKELIDDGVKPEEIDYYMEEWCYDDEYEMYHANKYKIFLMLGYRLTEGMDPYDQERYLFWWYGQVEDFLINKHKYSDIEAQYLLDICSDELDEYFNQQKPPAFAAMRISKNKEANDLMQQSLDEHNPIWTENDEKIEQHFGDLMQKVGKPKVEKDYSKMTKVQLDKEVSDALDRKDYETLNKLRAYIKENYGAYYMPRLNERWGAGAASLGMRGKASSTPHKSGSSGNKNEWKKYVDPRRWFSAEKEPENVAENPKDETDVLQDVMDAGNQLLSIFKELGFESAHLSSMGRTKRHGGGYNVGIWNEHEEFFFTIYKDGEVYYTGTIDEEWEDWNIGNIEKTRSVIKKNLEEILI